MWISKVEYTVLLARIEVLEDRMNFTRVLEEKVNLLLDRLGLVFYEEPSVPKKLTLITKKEYAKRVKSLDSGVCWSVTSSPFQLYSRQKQDELTRP